MASSLHYIFTTMLFKFENLHWRDYQSEWKNICHCFYQKQTAQVTLIVITGDGPSLLGHDWLKNIVLDWNQLNQVHQSTSHCQELVERHKELFNEELGLVKGMKAKFQMLLLNFVSQGQCLMR